MTSTIKRVQSIDKRVVSVSIQLIAKDAADSLLIDKFGDILIDPSGEYSDPNDLSYPKFRVYAGDPVPFYTQQVVRAIFSDTTLTLEDLQRRANLWGDAITLKIQNAMIALRTKEDDVTTSTTVNI